jgi:UDP-glucose 4-epimerase
MACTVLGSEGFIGKHLCSALSAHEVRRFSHSLGHDFQDTDSLHAFLHGSDIVFHLISATVPANENESGLTASVLPTLRMLKLAKEYGARVIFASSGGTVYGVSDQRLTEESPTEPICFHGAHKLLIEKYLRISGVDYRILRISNVYGPGQGTAQPQGVIAHFAQRIKEHQPIEVWGDGSAVRDYVHVADVVDAFVKAAQYTGSHRVFNIGRGIGYSVQDVLSLMNAQDVRFLEPLSEAVPSNILDYSRARQELGWVPTRNLSEYIATLGE